MRGSSIRVPVRRIRVTGGTGNAPANAPRPGPPQAPRGTKAQAGMLLDSMPADHAWLAERGPRLKLASPPSMMRPAWCRPRCFVPEEDAAGYLDDASMCGWWLKRSGCPEAVYHDRHGIFLAEPEEREHLEEQLAGEREPTQVGRALRELGIASIMAHSPQAKGRVERLFGALQDRLVAELELAGRARLPKPMWSWRLPTALQRPLRCTAGALPPSGLPSARDRPLADLLLSLCAHRGARRHGPPRRASATTACHHAGGAVWHDGGLSPGTLDGSLSVWHNGPAPRHPSRSA